MADELPPVRPAYRTLLERLEARCIVQPPAPPATHAWLRPLRRLIDHIAGWYIEPLREQQNAINVATVHVLQAYADALDRLNEHAVRLDHDRLVRLERDLLDAEEIQVEMLRRAAQGAVQRRAE
jgi:iron-sulfur cluster repair protein YtfE (RIC family)